jgi:hypothetical protein
MGKRISVNFRQLLMGRGIIAAAIICLLNLTGCKSTDECPHVRKKHEVVTGRGPKRIYVPEYFVYRNGKYEFVEGHYRWVLLPKVYVKRSMKGYVTKPEAAASIR